MIMKYLHLNPVSLEHYFHTIFSCQLSVLSSEKQSLLELWEERKILYDQCMDLQLFYRDMEHADAWMTKQEVHLHINFGAVF